MLFFKGRLSFNSVKNEIVDDWKNSSTSHKGEKTFFFNHLFFNGAPFEIHLFETSSEKTIHFEFSDKETTHNLATTKFTESDYLAHLQQSRHKLSLSIWFHREENRISISRDSFGQIPVFYRFTTNQEISFSSHIASLFPTEYSDSRYPNINGTQLEPYFSVRNLSAPYRGDTFFSDIHSLPPGHFLTVNHSGLTVTAHTDYNPGKYNSLTSLSDFGQHFKDLFIKGIHSVTRDYKILGMHLSGGLDSSSVAVSTHSANPDKPLHTFFFETPDPSIDESGYAGEVAQIINSSHHVLRPGSQQFDDLYQFTRLSAQPLFMIGATGLNTAAVKAARLAGCDVLLTGHDGDSVVGNGKFYLDELFNGENWDELRFELLQYLKTDNYRLHYKKLKDFKDDEAVVELLKNLFARHCRQAITSRKPEMLFKLVLNAHKVLGLKKTCNLFIRLISGIKNRSLRKPIDKTAILKDSFLEQNKRVLRACPETSNLKEPELEYYNSILFNQNVRVNEDYFSLMSLHGISIQHPFFNKDLYELCLAVPEKIRFNHGYFRGPLREAMRGLLPASILTRTTKSNFNNYLTQSTLALHEEALDILQANGPVWDIVQRDRYFEFIEMLKKEKRTNSHHQIRFTIFRVLCLAIWLDIYDKGQFINPQNPDAKDSRYVS